MHNNHNNRQYWLLNNRKANIQITESQNETEWMKIQNKSQCTVKCTHIISWTVTLIRWNERSWDQLGTYWALKGHIAQSQEVSPWSSPLRSEGSQDDQGGGGWSFWSEAKSLKAKPREHQARVHSDQMVLVMVRQEAGCVSLALKGFTLSR
jgi:hypothetical protein